MKSPQRRKQKLKATVKDKDWDALLELERNQRAALKEPKYPDSSNLKKLRAWWLTVEEIFCRMVAPSGAFNARLPMELFSAISGLSGYLAVGQIPEPISGVASKGRAAPGPTETRHIRAAVTYRKAVEDGLIRDPKPTRTIMRAYGLESPRTSQKWCTNIAPSDISLYKWNPKPLKTKMLQCGEAYKQANRRIGAATKKRYIRDRKQ